MDTIMEVDGIRVKPETETHTVPLAGLHLWEEKIGQINRRADRHGMPRVTYTVSDLFMVKYPQFPIGHPLHDPMVMKNIPHAEITYATEPVKLDGYRPIATIEYEHSTPTANNWPGEVIDVETEVPSEPICDHCRAIRQRNKIFLLEHDDGKRFHVGSTCVRDFIGYDPANIMRQAEWIKELLKYFVELRGKSEDELKATGVRGKQRISLLEVLSVTNAAIREHGWLSRTATADRGTSTADRVSDHMFAVGRFKLYSALTVTQEDLRAAVDTVTYVEAIENPRNNYEMNLSAMAADMYCTPKEFNLAVSMVNFFVTTKKFDNDRQKRDDSRAKKDMINKSTSQHVGEVGERINFPSVKVEFMKNLVNNYGDSTLIKFSTPEGNRLTWFSSRILDDMVGETVGLVGTVKQHGEYNDVQETTLIRCKID